MAKLPVWNEIIAESYPQPIGDGTTASYPVQEGEMTAAQRKKREEIVLSMKHKIKDFKERYGKRWKEVLYRTATKMAMKSHVNELANTTPTMTVPIKTGMKVQTPNPQTKRFDSAVVSKVTPAANGTSTVTVNTGGRTSNVSSQVLSMGEAVIKCIECDEPLSPAEQKKASGTCDMCDLTARNNHDRRRAFDMDEDTGIMINKPPYGGVSGSSAGLRHDGINETVTRILEAITYDVSSNEAAEPQAGDAQADATDTPNTKKVAPQATPAPKKMVAKDTGDETADEPTKAYVLYRYNPTLGWSPHFINPAKDGALESPVYSTLDDAKKAYRRNASQSPKSISFRLRELSAQQGAKIHAKFEELGKTLGYDTIKEEKDDPNADPTMARMQVKAAAAIAHALSQGRGKTTGETPSDLINDALKVWVKDEHSPESLQLAAEMLRTANKMGIEWSKKIVGNKLKDYLGEAAGPATQTHWSQQWQYGADLPVKKFQRWKTACGKLVLDKEMSASPTCPQCKAASDKDDAETINI